MIGTFIRWVIWQAPWSSALTSNLHCLFVHLRSMIRTTWVGTRDIPLWQHTCLDAIKKKMFYKNFCITCSTLFSHIWEGMPTTRLFSDLTPKSTFVIVVPPWNYKRKDYSVPRQSPYHDVLSKASPELPSHVRAPTHVFTALFVLPSESLHDENECPSQLLGCRWPTMSHQDISSIA